MNWNVYLGTLSALLFLAPAAIIFFSRLYTTKSLAGLGVYCLLNGIHAMLSLDVFALNEQVLNAFGVINNYLDTPLMLLVLLLFCHSKRSRTVIRILALAIVFYEAAIGFAHQLQPSSTLFISGPGLLMVFCCSFYFFVLQLKQTIRFGKGLGKTIIVAGVLFVYGCYAIIYCFYYLQEVSQVDDVFLLYHFASAIFCLMLLFGLLQLARLHKKLKQLLLVRKELAQFY